MPYKTEYIFEKDFWGNWKLVPKKQENSIAWLILLLIILLIICLAILTLPFWIALLGFKMVKTKRYYAGVGSLLALLYFIFDIQKRWITGFIFLGYNDSDGNFTEGLFNEKQIVYVYILNGIGVLLGLYFIVQAYLLNKQKKIFNHSTSESETSSAYSNSSNDFSISNSKPKRFSNQVNLVLGILGVVFVIVVIYFYLNKKDVSNEAPLTNSEVINEQPLVPENEIELTSKNDVSYEESQMTFSQDELLNFINQYYYDISNNSFNAENYFSENITQYINRKNISPIDINDIHNNNNEFIDEKTNVINNEINFDRTEKSISYYSYWIDFSCFRKSKNKNQSCKVKIEIGIDHKNKIKSYRELEITDLTFFEKETSTERDPRAKDVANVFYNPNFTLFDLLTDEPIFPDSDGLFDIWYSSNEDPSPYNIVLSKNQLINHRYYKFKTKANCIQ
jgi:hypothetical protein